MSIVNRIKEIRKQEALSQTAFGKKLGVSKDVIVNIENLRVEPKPLLLNCICETFNIRKEWLLEGTGDMYIISKADDALAEALAEITLSENEQLKQIVMKLSKLNDVSLDSINNLIDVILNSSTQ